MRATVYIAPDDEFSDDPLQLLRRSIPGLKEVVVKQDARMLGRDRLLIVLDGGALDKTAVPA